MYLYFDEFGVLREIINDEAVRFGDVDSKTMYIYVDSNIKANSIWLTIERPDKTKTLEKALDINAMITKEIPYNKNRDMKYFEDYKEYSFYTYTLTSEDINAGSGLYKATARIGFNGGSLAAQGMITFFVENNVIKSDHEITQSQYDYLIQFINENVQEIERAYIKDVSYNPNSDIITFTRQDNSTYEISLIEFLNGEKGIPNGVAPLDLKGLIPHKHIPLANETEIGGFKAKRLDKVQYPSSPVFIDKNDQKAHVELRSEIEFSTDNPTNPNSQELKTIKIADVVNGNEVSYHIPDFEYLRDKINITSYMSVNPNLNSGSITQEGYNLVSNPNNDIFVYHDSKNRVLVLTKETNHSGYENSVNLSCRHYENQRFYFVRFTIHSNLQVNVGGIDYITENDMLQELMAYATKQYVESKIAALIDTAPEDLNTLNELAQAIKNNKNIVEMLTNSINSKQDKVDNTLTTFEKSVVGAINELNAKMPTITDYIKKVGFTNNSVIQFTLNDNTTFDVNLNTFLETQKGIANGIAPLNHERKIPNTHIPSATPTEYGGVKAELINTTNYPSLEGKVNKNSGKLVVEMESELVLSDTPYNTPNALPLSSIVVRNLKSGEEQEYLIQGGNFKEIALFGEYRIAVPKDTKATNVDLYCHMIHVKGDANTGVSNFDLYFEFYSSKNLIVNSLQDMNNILGKGFYRSCCGLAKSKLVYAIFENNGVIRVKCNNGSEELLQGVVIEDMVKTI